MEFDKPQLHPVPFHILLRQHDLLSGCKVSCIGEVQVWLIDEELNGFGRLLWRDSREDGDRLETDWLVELVVNGPSLANNVRYITEMQTNRKMNEKLGIALTLEVAITTRTTLCTYDRLDGMLCRFVQASDVRGEQVRKEGFLGDPEPESACGMLVQRSCR